MSLISLPAFLHRREDSSMPENATDTTNAVVMRFLTQGDAVVELRTLRFRTNYTWQGRPYVSDDYHEVDGFTWRCLGCDKRGTARQFSAEPYLPNEAGQARDEANQHAAACRAMPKPQEA